MERGHSECRLEQCSGNDHDEHHAAILQWKRLRVLTRGGVAGARGAGIISLVLRVLARAAAVVLCVLAAGCGGTTSTVSSSSTRNGLEQYLKQVEPIRLSVNRLLEGADPILGAFHEHRITSTTAARQMNALERRFARLAVDIAAVEPRIPVLGALHAAYAQTFVLEDAYLSALANDLSQGSLTDLPNTQSEQRAAIIRWRTGLAALARKVHLALPADLQVAGRGEIAPSPEGTS